MAHQPIGQVWGWTLLGDTLGRARQGDRLSLLFSCKAVFLFIAGDPIVSPVNRRVKAVVRLKEALPTYKFSAPTHSYSRKRDLGRNG